MRSVIRALALFAGSAALSAGATLAGCVGDDPDTTPAPPDASTSPESGTDATVDAPAADGGSDPGNVVQLAAGGSFACARTSMGFVYCWGDNSVGATGQPASGDTLCGPASAPCRPPTRVAGIDDVAFIAAGGSSACAVKTDGTVHCWGSNQTGQLGRDPGSDPFCPGSIRCSSTPTKVEGLGDIVGMAIGPGDACAYTKQGRVFCWGANQVGQLANGTHGATIGAPSPVAALPSGVTQIFASNVNAHYCARKTDGTMHCWGRNQSGELGYPPGGGANQNCGGTTWCQPNPTLVQKPDDAGVLSMVESMAGGDSATCASVGGTVWCWGYQGHAMVGFSADVNVPVRPLPSAPAQLGGLAGSHTHACAIGVGGVTYCWGTNDKAQTANPSDPNAVNCIRDCNPVPSKVENVRAASLSAGANYTLALTPEGEVLGWGTNERGELGHAPDATELAACEAGACVPVAKKIPILP